MKMLLRAVMGALHGVALLAGAGALLPHVVQAQTPAAVIEMAEKDRAARNATAALNRYEAALVSAPANYELLWRASRELIDLAEAAPTKTQHIALNSRAESYARRAVAANAGGADGRFMLAVALGRTALSVGSRERVKYATEIHDQAAAAVKIDPRHAGALHVLGMWNAEIMRLSGITRFAARNFLGAKVFGRANWADARKYLEAAVSVDPGRITHRLDLAEIYADNGDEPKAMATCEEALRMPTVEFNDARYKKQCEQLVVRLR